MTNNANEIIGFYTHFRIAFFIIFTALKGRNLKARGVAPRAMTRTTRTPRTPHTPRTPRTPHTPLNAAHTAHTAHTAHAAHDGQ